MKSTKEEDLRRQTQEAVVDPYRYPLPDEGTSVVVDRVRTAIKAFAYASFKGGWRTLVFLEAHRMRAEQANALLKTLEEPPARSLIVLTAPAPAALLSTIVSRCQKLTLPPAAIEGIQTYLRSSVTGPVADYAAEASGGDVRRAIALTAEDVVRVQSRALDFLDALVTGSDAKTFAALEKLAVEKQGAFDVLRAADTWLADTLRFRQCGEGALASGSTRLDGVRRLAGVFDEGRIAIAAEEIERIRDMNRRNINLHLSLVAMWRRLKGAPSAMAV